MSLKEYLSHGIYKVAVHQSFWRTLLRESEKVKPSIANKSIWLLFSQNHSYLMPEEEDMDLFTETELMLVSLYSHVE